MQGGSRRNVLRAWGAAVALATSAALLPGCDSLPLGPRLIEISQETLFARMAEQFPFSQRMMDAFDVTVDTPRFRLIPQENRIGTELDVTAGQTLLPQAFKGKLALSYGLRFEPSDSSLRLAGVRVERFFVDGAPGTLQSRINRIGGVLAEELLNDYVVHRLDPKDVRLAEAVGLRPGAINVTGRGLSLALEPIRR